MNATRDDNTRIQELLRIDKKSLSVDGGEKYNRLIFAKSPYLLQHAENPVDWHQWGNEAFAKAKNENKPVFVSIGYATCHWCHVMEQESFEDESVAEVLNRDFISIKVDREERPDIDDQYMSFAQLALEGGAGWPLNLFLHHDKKPFYVTTYMPRNKRSDNPGIIEILEQIADTWRNRMDVVETTCTTAIQNLSSKAEPLPAPIPEGGVFSDAARYLESIYDREWGGFGTSPKFPRPIFLSFLLLLHKRDGNEKALEMAEHALRLMRQGGIYDQVGMGFHRYAVDRQWLVPHFEKMLYDQGMLAISYLEAFQTTGKVFFRDVAEEIFSYVIREMTSPEGGFYSATDADSEGVEGKYYLWTPAEIRTIFAEETAETLCDLFQISEKGNFEGGNILHLQMMPDEFAARRGVTAGDFGSSLKGWQASLLSAREKRVRPLRDEMVLTSWNGLMLASLAKGFAVTGNRAYLERASACATFISKRMTTTEGRLMHRFFADEAAVPGFLEDYAFFIWGLLELYEATLDSEYLSLATALSRQTLKLFADDDCYGLFDTGIDVEDILIRKKGVMDGVVPSGNSVAAANFIRLGKIAGKKNFIREGEGILRSLMGDLLAQPLNHLNALSALNRLHGPDLDITLVGRQDDPETEDMLRVINRRYIPGLVLRLADAGGDTALQMKEGRTTAYICSKGACRPPVEGCNELEEMLARLGA